MGSICSSCEREKEKPDAITEPTTDAIVATINATEEKLLSEDEFRLSLERSNIQDGSLQPSIDPMAARLCHPLEISRQHSITFDSRARIDISTKDYRSFCLLIHRKQGGVLLHCTRKKRKPPHYQLPGGHVDDCEFKQITKSLSNLVTQEQLYYAARIGCAREVFEETGIDFRNRLEEFLPMVLYNTDQDFKNEILINEYKNRFFFVCEVFDEDFPCAQPSGSMKFSSSRFPSLPKDFSCDLMLQLSVEHSGFRFVKESSAISKSLTLHSGGKVEKAVTMAYSLVNANNGSYMFTSFTQPKTAMKKKVPCSHRTTALLHPFSKSEHVGEEETAQAH